MIVQTTGRKEFLRIQSTAGLQFKVNERNEKGKLVKSRDIWESYNAWKRLLKDEREYFETGNTKGPKVPLESSLRLPSYSNVRQIEYRHFIQGLRNLNPEETTIDSLHARTALEQVIIGVIGEEDFEKMKLSSKGGVSRTAWKRLMDEAAGYIVVVDPLEIS